MKQNILPFTKSLTYHEPVNVAPQLPHQLTDICKKLAIILSIMLLCFFLTEPALAQSWGNKVAEQANNVKTNMRIFAGALCGAVLFWIAFQIMWGGKRLADTQNYWVGIVLIVVVEELIAQAIT